MSECSCRSLLCFFNVAAYLRPLKHLCNTHHVTLSPQLLCIKVISVRTPIVAAFGPGSVR